MCRIIDRRVSRVLAPRERWKERGRDDIRPILRAPLIIGQMRRQMRIKEGVHLVADTKSYGYRAFIPHPSCSTCSPLRLDVTHPRCDRVFPRIDKKRDAHVDNLGDARVRFIVRCMCLELRADKGVP